MSEEQKNTMSLEELLSLDWTGEEATIDATADAFEQAPPPPRAVYKIKPNLSSKDPITVQGDPKTGKKWLRINLECLIVSDNKEYDGMRVFTNVSTYVSSRKHISTCLGVIQKLGFKLEDIMRQMKKNTLNDKDQVKVLQLVLKKERLAQVEVDWRASYDSGVKNKETGKNEWVNVYNTYEEFPEDYRVARFLYPLKDGSGSVELRPQLEIKEWFDYGSTPGPLKSRLKGGAVAGATEAPKAKEKAMAEPMQLVDDGPSPITAATAIKAPVAATTVATPEDELAFLND